MSKRYHLFRYGVRGLVSATSASEARKVIRDYHGEPRKLGRKLHPRTKISMWDVSRDESYFMAASAVARINAGKVIQEIS